MENVTPIRPDVRLEDDRFNVLAAKTAARTLGGTLTFAAWVLAEATGRDGHVVMTHAELGRRMRKAQNTAKMYAQKLVKAGLVSRVRNTDELVWNQEKIAELAKRVSEEDAEFSPASVQFPGCKFGAADVMLGWTELERIWRASELRTAKERAAELGRAPRLSRTAGPSTKGRDYLLDWTPRFALEVEREISTVTDTTWKIWRSIPGRTVTTSMGTHQISYKERGWPFCDIPTELEHNPKFELRIRAALTRTSEKKPSGIIPVEVVDQVEDLAIVSMRVARAAAGGAQ